MALVAFAAVQFAGLVHQVTVVHTVCKAHGGMLHGSHGCAETPADEPDAGSPDDRHCRTEPAWSQPASTLAGVPLGSADGFVGLRPVLLPPPPRATRATLWLLAPKTSPPRCAT